MPLPSQPVTLSAEQVKDLNTKLATARHDINNQLSCIMAAVELSLCKPEMGERMMALLVELPSKISASVAQFSKDFEQTVGITRP